MKPSLFLILVLTGITSCTFLHSESDNKNNFYTQLADWDARYIPVAAPFKVLSITRGYWSISAPNNQIHTGTNSWGMISLDSFGVSKNYIYGKTTSNRWFLFNMYSLLYSDYATENELTETLKIYKLDKNHIDACENYYKELTDNKTCYWFPEAGKTYPVFDDYRPDSCYTIKVEGNSKVTGFRLQEKVKKTVSKIYYFKMNYGNSANDLYYVSFDYSTPRLIKNNEIIAAYAEDNTSLNISVYTPYPIAQNKGIGEKERVVLSKQIMLY